MMPPGLPSARTTSALLLGTDLSTGGGVNRVIADLSALLANDLGIETTVVSARSTAPPTYALSPQVHFEQTPFRRSSRTAYLCYLTRLRRRRFNFALGFWTQDNIALALTFAGSGTGVIACEHDSWFNRPAAIRALRRMAYRHADVVAVLNERERAHYARFHGNARLIPNPISGLDQPPIGVPRERLAIMVGHLIPRKGPADAVTAFLASGLAERGWRLALIGGGEEQPKLEAMLAAARTDAIEIVKPTPDILTWYRRASCIIVPSYVEVFSLVLTEAIAAGVVPVAYRADGPASILTGFPDHLVAIGDRDALAHALRRCASADLAAINGLMRESLTQRMSRQRVAELWKDVLTCNS